MKFDTLKAPGPTQTPVTAPFWHALAEGRFELQRCKQCDHRIFYPRPFCPDCWSEDLAWESAQPKGTLESFTVIHRPGHPAWEVMAPYVNGIVSLADGPRMLSLILLESPDDARVGMALRLVPTRVGDAILPFFGPVE